MKTAQPPRNSRSRGGPLAIFVATAAEIRPLIRALRATYPSKPESASIWHVELGGRELLLVKTGMGPENAQAVARRLFEKESVEVALAVGLAAGLDPRLQTGDLIVGNEAIFHRTDDAASETFTCNLMLQESALTVIRRAGHRYHLGPIATVKQIVLTREEKRRLGAESGAMAVDMESAAIASVASARGVPFLAIRVILDPVNEDLNVAFDQFLNGRGEPRPLPLTRYLIAHPLAVPRLVGLWLRTKAACTRLGELLRSFCILQV